VVLGQNFDHTAADGSFTVSASPGAYTLGLNFDGGDGLPEFQLNGPTIDLTEGNVVQNITIPTATVNVTVLDSFGTPVPGATLDGQSANVSFTGYPGATFTGTIDGQGGSAGVGGVISYTSILGAGAISNYLNGPGGSPVVQVSIPAVTTDPTNTTVYLEPPGQAPAITSAATATSQTGSPLTVTITSTGTPVPALTETGPLPAGVTFTDNGDGTAILAGTAAGTYPITISASNGIGQPATQSFTLTVTPAPLTCTSTINGTHSTQRNVISGVTCLVNATQSGAVTVASGAALVVTNSTIKGTVTATSAASVELCGVTENGTLSVSGTTGDVTLGGTLPDGAACAADSIPSLITIGGTAGPVTVVGLTENGTLTLSGNSGGVVLNAIKLSGLTYVENNSGTVPITITANQVNGSLYCTGNTPAPNDNGTVNIVSGTATAQCAALAVR